MATNPYTPIPIGPDYNLDPPSDDGATTENNRLQWSKHKGKLSDPIVGNNSANYSAIQNGFGKTINTDPDEKNTIAGSLGFESSDLTVNSGKIDATRSYHRVDTESGAATDDLTEIDHTQVDDGALLILIGVDPARIVTVKQAASPGNIILDNGADFALSENATIYLQRRGTVWVEINRSPVGALPVTLDETTISSALTAYDLFWDNTTNFSKIELLLSDVLPVSDSEFRCRLSTDGSTFESGASDYSFYVHGSAVSAFGDSSVSESYILLGGRGGGTVASTNSYLTMTIVIANPELTTRKPNVQATGGYLNSSAGITQVVPVGWRQLNQEVNGIRLFFNGSNIASGNIIATGYVK